MIKAILPGILAISIGLLSSNTSSYANIKCPESYSVKLFQDTTHKKGSAGKAVEKDRTKGEGGTDSSSRGTGSGKQGNDSGMNRSTQDRTDQNSDNRGEGTNKNNRTGNGKSTDSTRQQ